MFGIGLPELILIMGIALIVVGPEKLPELARGLAKQVLELKKAANLFKESLKEEADDSKPWEQNLPEGFSRPEELAAAGRKVIEGNRPQGDNPVLEDGAGPGKALYPDSQDGDVVSAPEMTETDAGKNVDGR
ncbi:MAG: twin-arginine translocase TatA/TatE family subunit [Proteobacteria bacterium]|nr:twin-arginine translocase TatA/TatE family subunit [Pseudomonadota bacterium]MBU1737737.1 twin-arginine translocase TatA/TatE family subunit [Pseudomonadota bacterium]